MGYIEITTSVGTRRIRVEELTGVIRIDLAGDQHTVSLPHTVEVTRPQSKATGARRGSGTLD